MNNNQTRKEKCATLNEAIDLTLQIARLSAQRNLVLNKDDFSGLLKKSEKSMQNTKVFIEVLKEALKIVNESDT